MNRLSSPAWTPYWAFTSFGWFWGTWGASLPAIKSQADLSDGQLGSALLFVGMGALPVMAVTGRLIDRFGVRAAAASLALLSVSNVVVALGSRGPGSVALCMLLVGATSGAADVAINTLAGESERASLRPVLARAHGVFSATVVLSSLLVGALVLAGASVLSTFALAAVAGLLPAAMVWAGSPHHRASCPTSVGAAPAVPRTASANKVPVRWLPFLTLGLVGSLAYAVENAHQSWGAVLITDVLASPALAPLAPATFAGTAAVTRLALAPLSRTHPVLLLTGGGLVAVAGTVVLATATGVAMALSGLALASIGTSLLFPTLLSYGLRFVTSSAAGQVTSVVSTTAYLGYLLGPAYVGLMADRAGLRAAFLGVALLALVFTVTGAAAGRWAAKDRGRADPSRDCAVPDGTESALPATAAGE